MRTTDYLLAKAYNKIIEDSLEDGTENLVLCHDDIIIETDVVTQLHDLFKTYDVIGVAGCSCIEIKSPVSWFIMRNHALKSGKNN